MESLTLVTERLTTLIVDNLPIIISDFEADTCQQNMKKYNCALLYGSSSRYAYDTYQAEFSQYDITAIYQANEWYWKV